MSKHSEGPWECGPELESDGRLVYITIRSHSTKIASSGVYGRKPNGKTTGEPYLDECGTKRYPPHATADECRANARLIAAAPELLEACRECVSAYEGHRDAQPTGHLWPDPNHIFHARAAIAKAEG